MYTISKTFAFCYGHRLCGDKGKCKNLHGHTAKTAIVLESENLDDSGMVYHFDKLKETIGRWISENLDHTMILSKDDPIAKLFDSLNERYLAIEGDPTAENIAKLIYDTAKGLKLPVICVEMWESETSKATYIP